MICETLSKFYDDSLPQVVAISMISSFEEAGIRSGRELAEVMKSVRDLPGSEESLFSMKALPFV